MNHTPTPWKIGAYESGCMAIDGANGEEVTGFIEIEDANRIVACVNACADIDTATLIELRQESTLAKMCAKLIADRDELAASCIAQAEAMASMRQQRDELLVALERFIDSHEECTDFDGFTAQIVSMDDCHEAQDAIARVKGGVDPKLLLPIERDCCGTFPRTPHRSTCKHYRGKKSGAA